jgi:uncharacterized membrane protein YbjE (DUF340 family)
MLVVIGLMFLGIAIGYLLRGKMKLGGVSQAITYAIYVLLFLLGVSVGVNPQIISNISTLGAEAVMITLGGVLGSVLAAWTIYKLWFKSNERSMQ